MKKKPKTRTKKELVEALVDSPKLQKDMGLKKLKRKVTAVPEVLVPSLEELAMMAVAEHRKKVGELRDKLNVQLGEIEGLSESIEETKELIDQAVEFLSQYA